MAIHAPITGAPLRAPLISYRLTPESRDAIASEIERLIAILDADGGDPDLEPDDDLCLAGDDGCGWHQAGLMRGWGSPADELMPMLPRYGLDQSAGPLNEIEAYRDWQRRERERGARR